MKQRIIDNMVKYTLVISVSELAADLINTYNLDLSDDRLGQHHVAKISSQKF